MPPRAKKRAASPAAAVDEPSRKTRTSTVTASDTGAPPAAATQKPTSKRGNSEHSNPCQLTVNSDDDHDTADQSGHTDVTGKTNGSDPTSKGTQVSKDLHVPIDDYWQLGPQWKVYIDTGDHGEINIFDASLNQTNAGKNNNKFYRLQLLTDGHVFTTFTRWGRVGEPGSYASIGWGGLDDALKTFEKKFRDKSGLKWVDRGAKPKARKYTYVERSYECDIDDDVPAEDGHDADDQTNCTLSAPVKSLMEFIFNPDYIASCMAELNYDADKLPLGKLATSTITRGYETLKELEAVLSDPTLASTLYNSGFCAVCEQLSNQYYSFIPHAFGRRRPPIIATTPHLKQEVELLDSLTDLKDSDSILRKAPTTGVDQLNSHFDGLGLQVCNPVATDTDEFQQISDYLTTPGGRGPLQGERFDKIKSDRRLLWHGSRAANYGGILSQGLRIAPPEAPVNGYMFGKGIYLADMSSKSAGYCCSFISGGHALLLLCDAELGAPMQQLTDGVASAGEDAFAKGLHSTWGLGTTGPSAWKDAKCIHPDLEGVKMPDTTKAPGATGVSNASLLYNEYICYNVAQVRLRYLLRVKM